MINKTLTRIDVLITVSDVAVDLLMDALTRMMLGALTNIGVDVNVNVFAVVMTSFEFVLPAPSEEFCC